MTNFEYIKNNLSERDLAYLIFPHVLKPNEVPSELFSDKIYSAWSKWAESASSNLGNMSKGIHGKHIIKEDPSIWFWERWSFPDGTWKKRGRNHIVSFSVWLSMQYNPDDWIDEE